jgi:hypothetical protein
MVTSNNSLFQTRGEWTPVQAEDGSRFLIEKRNIISFLSFRRPEQECHSHRVWSK